MKTYLRRWWVINRLYHFLKIKGVRNVKSSHFRLYLAGWKDQDNLFDKDGNIINPTKPFILKWPLSILSDATDYDSLFKELNDVIEECKNKEWIKTDADDGNALIRLGAIGKEEYAVTSLIGKKLLGNSWVKAIGTGFIVGVLVWWITYRIESINIKPQPIEIYLNGQQATIPQSTK